MATDVRHAAGQSYEVHECPKEDLALRLGLRYASADFGAAVDFAFDFLERRDPQREGTVSALHIVHVQGAERETVWSYDHASPGPSRDPVGVWGFDVTRPWQSPYRPPTRPRTARIY